MISHHPARPVLRLVCPRTGNASSVEEIGITSAGRRVYSVGAVSVVGMGVAIRLARLALRAGVAS
jgi:hypothetical protein